MSRPPPTGALSWIAAAGYERDDAGCWARPDAPAFAYSDGAQVEARIEQAIASCTDRSVLSEALRRHIVDWPSRYHLSPVRANLLRPLVADIEGRDVLEIGAGCGAISRFLGEAGARSVVALEGSRQRARSTALRCADLPNVASVAESLQALRPEVSFDVVTLIGVLEYARIHFRTGAEGDPVAHMLAAARARLRPGGVLIVAIENQLGLKYYAGYDEDHVATPFFGIEDGYAADGVVTFGRRELAQRIADAGLPAQHWYFPFPDYKLPCMVATAGALDHPEGCDLVPLLQASVPADPQAPDVPLYSLAQAWAPVFRNGLAGDLANSFLIVASDEAAGTGEGDLLAVAYAAERRPCFAKQTVLRRGTDGPVVEVAPLAPQASGDVHGDVRQVLEAGRYVAGELWSARLVALTAREGWTLDDIVGWLDVWVDALGAPAPVVGSWLPEAYWDAVPRNLVVSSGAATFIDLEWRRADAPRFEALFYRGVLLSLLGLSSVAQPADPAHLEMRVLLAEILKRFGVPADSDSMGALHALEMAFQQDVNGCAWIDFDNVMRYRLPLVRARHG